MSSIANDAIVSKIKERCDKILSGMFDSDDVELLFVYMRDHYFNDSADLWDISNFLAHSKHRDEGKSFDASTKFLDILTKVAKGGGQLPVKAIYRKDKVLDQLCAKLRLVPVYVNRRRLGEHKKLIFQAIYRMMDGVPLLIQDPIIKECKMKLLKDQLCLSVRFNNLPGPVITLSDSVELCFPVFE